MSNSPHPFKIQSQRYISQVIILFAEGSSVADIAMLHYSHTKKTRGHNLGQAVGNHRKHFQLIESEMQNSSFSERLRLSEIIKQEHGMQTYQTTPAPLYLKV